MRAASCCAVVAAAISRAESAGLIEGRNSHSREIPADFPRRKRGSLRYAHVHACGQISRAESAGLIEGPMAWGEQISRAESAGLSTVNGGRFPAQKARASLKAHRQPMNFMTPSRFPAQKARASLKGVRQDLRTAGSPRGFPAQKARASLKARFGGRWLWRLAISRAESAGLIEGSKALVLHLFAGHREISRAESAGLIEGNWRRASAYVWTRFPGQKARASLKEGLPSHIERP